MTSRRRFLRFNAVSAAGFGVQLSTVAALTTWLETPVEAATAIAVAAAIVHNFAWHRRWTWGDRGGAREHVVRTFLRFAGANGVVSVAGNVAVVAVLVSLTGLHVVAANVIGVAISGLLNYKLSNRVVFRPQPQRAS
jgi:putative flippase GtrA